MPPFELIAGDTLVYEFSVTLTQGSLVGAAVKFAVSAHQNSKALFSVTREGGAIAITTESVGTLAGKVEVAPALTANLSIPPNGLEVDWGLTVTTLAGFARTYKGTGKILQRVKQ